jgi:hypothetical protein
MKPRIYYSSKYNFIIIAPRKITVPDNTTSGPAGRLTKYDNRTPRSEHAAPRIELRALMLRFLLPRLLLSLSRS